MALVGNLHIWSGLTQQSLLGMTYGVSTAGFTIDALIRAAAVLLETRTLARLLLYVHAAA
jgi:hypothetical protein